MSEESKRSKIEVSPSILSANFGSLNKDIASVESFVDRLHIDVMDGHFVPNISFGPVVVKDIKSNLPKDVHLMISEPEKYIDEFIKAGADVVIVHAEVSCPMLKLLHMIHKHGKKAGISINPKTDIDKVLPYLKDITQVLFMSVNPGFGGQGFMPEVLEKVKLLDSARKINRAKKLKFSIDGGINADTAKLAVEAGVDILVAGSYIFSAEDREKAVKSLRN